MLVVALPVLFLMAAGPYDVALHEENLMVPMRDGVRLATDIYRRKVVAENAIYHDRVRASHIVLPLVPTKSH